jgi:AcrR family transcriptional regulator
MLSYPPVVTVESSVRSRTRRAILSATASVLARDPDATLPVIAEAAGVGRTTLHRYFPDREALVAATVADSVAAIEQAVAEAAVEDGPVQAAMRRLVAALVAVGDRLIFLFADPRVLAAHGTDLAAAAQGDPVLGLIERGQAEGVLDAGVDADWIRHTLWALVYTGWEAVQEGRLPRHGVTATVVRTLEGGILARPQG